jgi:hypothetical protein
MYCGDHEAEVGGSQPGMLSKHFTTVTGNSIQSEFCAEAWAGTRSAARFPESISATPRVST